MTWRDVVTAWGLGLVMAALQLGCGNRAQTLTELQRIKAGELDVVLLSPHNGVQHGQDTFILEFRSNGNLVDVGEVRASATMAMPGMPDMDRSGKPMAPMPGMLTPEQMDALRKATGSEFDYLFLTGMIQHHGGALVMVKNLVDTAGAAQDAELFNFATDVDNTQRAEIRIMQNMLKEKH